MWALRALGARLDAPTDLLEYSTFARTLQGLGQYPFSWPAPDGYPDTEPGWLDTGGLIGRWNLVGDLLAAEYPPITVTPSLLRTGLNGRTAAEIYDLVAQRTRLETITPVGRAFLHDHTGWSDASRPSNAQIDAALPAIAIAILGAPDSQYR
jgi:hypothetical protein